MRFRLKFELKDGHLPVDYHSSLISFIKKTFQSADNSFYEHLFAAAKPTYKPYTFAVRLPGARFESDEIVIPSKLFQLTFSTHDPETAVYAANGFARLLYSPFKLPGGNQMKPVSLRMVREAPVKADKILIRLMSPLLVRDHEALNDKKYLLPGDSRFIKCLRHTVRYQLERATIADPNLSEEFNIIPVQHKKVVIHYYGQTIDGSIGTFMLSGPRILLEHLYQSGLGSRRGAGFGMFEILCQEGD